MIKVIMIALAALIAAATPTPVEARQKANSPKIHRVIRDVSPVYASLPVEFSAKRKTRRHAGRGGSCNGFDRCRCGTTAARHFGLPYDHNGWNLKMAREWYRFPHTVFGIGVAGVVNHHVLAIVGGSDCRTATVSDDAGTYQRNVCGMTFVTPGGGVFASSGDTTTYHGRARRGRWATGVADTYATPQSSFWSHGAIL